MERRKPDTFTTEEILYFFSRLKELGEGLDKMLLEYQPEKRRNEINELRVFATHCRYCPILRHASFGMA